MRVKLGLIGVGVAVEALGFLLAVVLVSGASAHSNPCHSQHTCPSDHHTYVWVDTAGQGWDCAKPDASEYNPALDVQRYVTEARPLRNDPMKRTCPTWHGGVAYQPTAYNPVKNIAYGVGTEGCHTANGMTAAFKGPGGGFDREKFSRRTFTSDLYYGAITAYDAKTQKVLAKAVSEIEIRSGVLATAGGVVFTALQDGWVVAYDDEKLEELWRFNVGTPLKGAPVTYAIGPKQYLAVQSSGRHVHPVKYDNLQSSSYLFVFALN